MEGFHKDLVWKPKQAVRSFAIRLWIVRSSLAESFELVLRV